MGRRACRESSPVSPCGAISRHRGGGFGSHPENGSRFRAMIVTLKHPRPLLLQRSNRAVPHHRFPKRRDGSHGLGIAAAPRSFRSVVTRTDCPNTRKGLVFGIDHGFPADLGSSVSASIYIRTGIVRCNRGDLKRSGHPGRELPGVPPFQQEDTSEVYHDPGIPG